MKYLLIVFFLLTVAVKPQELRLKGNLYSDSRLVMEYYKDSKPVKVFYEEKSKKSPFLAGILSAVLPGAGEFYTGSYWKAAAFLLVEAGAIYTAVNYDKKAQNQTKYFQGYADENWSAVKYAEYLNNYYKEKNSNNVDVISINPDNTLPPWKRVSFSQINSFEIGSHKLPPYGDQQYYELIGKYHQFSGGWNDFIFPPSGYTSAPAPSANLLFYSKLRGDANDLYAVSDRAVAVIYINHILSAADAVWSAIIYNKDIAVNVRMQETNYLYTRELSPVLNVRYSF